MIYYHHMVGMRYNCVREKVDWYSEEHDMKSSRQKYFEDYRVEKETADNRRGYKIVYVYKGEWLAWNEDVSGVRRRKRLYVAAALLQTFLLVLCGVQRVAFNTAGAVAIPGLISLVSLMYEWIGIVRFCMAKGLMQGRDCRRMYSFIEKGAVVTGLCYAVAVIAGLRQQILNGADLPSILVLLGFILCAVISFVLYAQHEKLSWRVEIEREEDGQSGENQ